MRYIHFIYIISLLSLSSCEKEDKALVLPPPGNLTRVVANIDPTYDKQVFVSLQKNMQVTRNLKAVLPNFLSLPAEQIRGRFRRLPMKSRKN